MPQHQTSNETKTDMVFGRDRYHQLRGVVFRLLQRMLLDALFFNCRFSAAGFFLAFPLAQDVRVTWKQGRYCEVYGSSLARRDGPALSFARRVGVRLWARV